MEEIKLYLQRPKQTMVDLQHLRNFLVVLEQKSISKAAALLRLAQPALSRQLQGLEHAFRTPLLLRSRRGITPTPAGEMLAIHARMILRSVQEAEDAVSMVVQRPAGKLAIGVTASIARLIIPPLAIAARSRLPDVQLSLSEDHGGPLVQRLLSGNLDMAVLHERKRLPGVETKPLFSEPIVAVGPPGVFSPERAVSMKEMLRFESLVTAPSRRLRMLYEEAIARSGAAEARLNEVDSFPSLIELIAAGAGVSLLPFSIIVPDVAAKRLSWAPLAPRPIFRSLVLARPEERIKTPAWLGVEQLIDEIVADRADTNQWSVTSTDRTVRQMPNN